MINNNVPETKPNDWFVVNVLNPQSSFEDLHQMAVIPSNTALQDKAFYREDPTIKKLFSDNPQNSFDQMAFNLYYDNLVQKYNAFEKEKYSMQDLTNNLYYSEYNYVAPINAKREKNSVQISKIFNPDSQKIGAIQPELWASSEFSIREIAQTQEVKNQNNVGLGFTPNDDSKSGLLDFWFDKFFVTKDVLALAQWTEDGTHTDPISGEILNHKKGEYKFNELGKYYYETLEGKTPLNRTLLSPWDTISDDGSWQNKFDFMDSDSKKKSVGATILKSVATITPYFIPGVGQYYALFTAAQTQQEFLPQIGTMVGRFVSGAEFDQSDLYKRLNSIQAFGTTMTMSSVSDNSMEKIWTWENLFTLVPEIFVQLKQQNALAKIPKWIKATNADAKQMNVLSKTVDQEKLKEARKLWKQALNTKDPSQAAVLKKIALLHADDKNLVELYDKWVNLENTIAKGLALSYMTAASAGEIDAVIEKFGIQGRDAAWMKLGVLQAFWMSMSTWSLGDWQVDYAVSLKDASKEINKLLRTKGLSIQKDLDLAGAKLAVKEVNENIAEGVVSSTWNQLKGLSGQEVFKKGLAFGKDLASRIDGSDIAKSIVKESIEEMSEETFTDGAKIVYNVFSDLNLTETKDKKINWDDDDVLSRYAMAGIGGALGGFLFHANESFLRPIKNQQFDRQLEDISIDLIRNNKVHELYEAIENVRNSDKGFASKNLSFSIYNKLTNVDGKTINFEPTSKDKLSQNDVIANVLKSQLQFLEKQIFNAHVPSTQQVQDVFAERTGSLLSINMHTAIEDDIKRASSQFVELYSKLEELNAKEKLDDAEEKRKAALFLELQTKQKEIEEITSEASIGKYYGEAMFNLDKHLNSTYTDTIDEEDIAQSLYKKGFKELNDVEKENVGKALTIENSREQLRIKKMLFDLQAKLFNTSIFTVNAQLDLRKDILSALSAVQFDYEKTKDEFDTEISPYIPQYGKNYLSDFLNATNFTIEQMVNNDTPVQNFEKFFVQVSGLIEKQQINPEQLTNDEFLLLNYLKKSLINLKGNWNKFINPNIVEYFRENYFNQNDIPEEYEFDFFHKGFNALLESKSISDIYFELKDNSEIKTENFIYQASDVMDYSDGSGHAALALEFLKLNNHPQVPFLEKQVQLFSGLINLKVLEKDPLFSQLDVLLSKFDVQYKSDTKNIVDLIRQERERLLEKPLEDYVNTSQITELEIKRQLEQLARLKVIIYAYTNFSLDPKTAIGYFPALNQYNQANGITEVYSQIPSDLSLFLLNHISEIEDRLNYLKKLSEQNQNSKIPNKEKAEAVINVLQTRQLLKILNNIVVPDEEKQLKDELSKIGDLSLFFIQDDEKELGKKLETLRISDLQNILETAWKIEITIQKYFSKLNVEKKKTFLNEIFTEFLGSQEKINKFRQEIAQGSFTEYKKQTKNISKIDTLIYTLSTLFANTESFVKDFNEFLTTTPTRFGLFGDQQNAFKLAHTIIQNQFADQFGLKKDLTFKEALNLFEERANKEIQNYINENPSNPKTFGKQVKIDGKIVYENDGILKFNYQNIFAIYGVQGTGKTEAILNFLSMILDKKGLNSIGLAHEENISEKLLNHLKQNKITNVKTQNLDQIFKLIFGTENYLELVKELEKPAEETELFSISNVRLEERSELDAITFNRNHPIITKIRQHLQEVQKQDLMLGKDVINILLIDEQTQTHRFIFELFNEYIELYNKRTSPNKLTALVTGDWRQNGQTIKYRKSVFAPNTMSEDLSLKSMDLNSSLRVGNNIKTFNAEELSNFAERSHTNQNIEKKIRLKNSVSGGLFGDFAQDFSNPASSPESIIKKLKELGISVKDIVLIQDEGNSDFQALAEKYSIDLVYTKSMNGIQYDYAIADVASLGSNNISGNSKLLNTFLTRSKKASFFNVQFIKDSGINLEQIDEKVVFDNSLKSEKIEQYKKKRILMINAIANSLLGTELITEVPSYTEEEEKTSDNSATKFSAGQFTNETEVSGKDLQKAFLEWNNIHTDDDEQREKTPSLLSKKLNLFGLIQMNHKFGNETDTTDPEEIGKTSRRFYNPQNRQRDTDIITSIAKSIFIKNLYGAGNAEETLYPELLKQVKKHIAKDIADLDLVFYNRKFYPDFDKRVDGSIPSRITVLSLKLTLTDGEVYYIPLGGQAENVEERLLDVDAEKMQQGEDIVLDRKYIVRFLSPNLGLNILQENVKIEDLQNAGFIVSPIYVLANSQFKEAKGNFVRNGREFVLVSKDRRLSPESLFNTFKSELNMMMNNKMKKDKLSKDYIDEQMLDAYALSDSSVKLVYLDRIGLPFYSETEKDWLTAISEGRSEKDFLTVRSFADAYVASQMLSVLTKKYIQLNSNSMDAKTGQRNTDALEPAELEFLTFYEELIKVLTVLAQYNENSTVLTKQLAGNAQNIIPILEKIDQTILSVKDKKSIDPMFTTDHKFVYLLKASIDGGSYKVGEKMISVRTLFDADAKKRIKRFISETLSESKMFSGGIHYTAQIGKGTKDEDFQYIQDKNTDINMFNVNRVVRNNIYLPLTLLEVKFQPPAQEQETSAATVNPLQKVFDNHITQLSIAMSGMTNISEETKIKVTDLFKEIVTENINDSSLSEMDLLQLFIDNANEQKYITIDRSPVVFKLTDDKIEIMTANTNLEKDEITLAKEELKAFLETTALSLNPEVINAVVDLFESYEAMALVQEQNIPIEQLQDIANKLEELQRRCQPDTDIDDPFD